MNECTLCHGTIAYIITIKPYKTDLHKRPLMMQIQRPLLKYL